MVKWVGDIAYLQNNDIRFILEEIDEVPSEIIDKVLASNQAFVILSLEQAVTFRYCFEQPNTIEWLRKQYWLLNYDIVSDMSKKELRTKIKEQKHRKKLLFSAYNHAIRNDRKFRQDSFKYSLLRTEYILSSYRIMLKKKRGKLKFPIP